MNIETVLLIVIVTFRVRFCAGPVECATKPLSTPAGGRRIAQSLDFAGTFSLETRRRLRSGLRPGNMAAAALRQFGHDERTQAISSHALSRLHSAGTRRAPGHSASA